MKSTSVIIFSALSLALLFLPQDSLCNTVSSTTMDVLASRIDRLEANLESELALLKKQLMEGNRPSIATPIKPPAAPSAAFTGVPTSCSDLLASGHISDGFYPVQNRTKIDMLYCNFSSMLASNSSAKMMGTRVGYLDVKTSSVYFHVRKNTSFSNPSGNALTATIPFEVEMMNIGNGMNLKSGVFTAPKAGIYHFAFSGLKSATGGVWVYLRLNGPNIAATHGASETGIYTMSLEATVKLKVGDKIYLTISGGIMFDNGDHFNGFTGALLEEDLTAL